MSTTVGTKITALEMELVRPQDRVRTTTLHEKNELIRKAVSVLEAHQAAERTIFSNESLSPQGKQQDLSKLGTTVTAPALQWLRNVLTRLQDTDKRYRTQFFTVQSGIEEKTVRVLTYTYLWSKLDLLDQKSRVTQFCQASEKDNTLTMAAMLEHPLGAMVDEEVKDRALVERAKRLTPRDYENFEQNHLLLEYLTMVRDWLGRWLAFEVGVEVSFIRTNLGDAIANVLTTQTTGIPHAETSLAGASK